MRNACNTWKISVTYMRMAFTVIILDAIQIAQFIKLIFSSNVI